MNKSELQQILNFLKIAEKLKQVRRYNATDTMKNKESTADHSWKVALMAMILADGLKEDLNLLKAIKIALVHDLVEAIAGDVDYRLIHTGLITKEEKTAAEAKAMKEIKASLPQKIGQEIEDLWLEYEKMETPEARYIKAIDKIEGLDHMVYRTYECFDDPERIAHYADPAVEKFPELKDLLNLTKEEIKIEFTKLPWEWKPEYDTK